MSRVPNIDMLLINIAWRPGRHPFDLSLSVTLQHVENTVEYHFHNFITNKTHRLQCYKTYIGLRQCIIMIFNQQWKLISELKGNICCALLLSSSSEFKSIFVNISGETSLKKIL